MGIKVIFNGGPTRILDDDKYWYKGFDQKSSPEIPVPYLTHIDVVEAGLEVLEVGRIKSGTVESLRFMNNKIWIIDDDLFE